MNELLAPSVALATDHHDRHPSDDRQRCRSAIERRAHGRPSNEAHKERTQFGLTCRSHSEMAGGWGSSKLA